MIAVFHNSDQNLWIAFQAGDEQAYAALYTNYFSPLYRYGKKFTQDIELIEDCIQDLYVNLWKSRENLTVPESVKNYLFKSLRFIIFKKLRFQEDFVHEEQVLEDYTAEVNPSLESVLIEATEQAEQKVKVENALKQLPKRQREAIFLKFYNEMTYQEIADVMDISVQAVYNLISKALMQLSHFFP
jgi:RNA polymerase sigma factor (sigma-70 family)